MGGGLFGRANAGNTGPLWPVVERIINAGQGARSATMVGGHLASGKKDMEAGHTHGNGRDSHTCSSHVYWMR